MKAVNVFHQRVTIFHADAQEYLRWILVIKGYIADPLYMMDDIWIWILRLYDKHCRITAENEHVKG